MKVEVLGVGKMRDRFKALAEIAPKEASKQFKIFLLNIQTDAGLSIQQGPKTGIVYGKHQASAPGEAPAADSGQLAKSIRHVISADGLSGYVIADTPYAARLEYGDNVKKSGMAFIEPRPFMFPALRRNIPIFLANIKSALKEAVRRI